jgi:hypothetical protein
MKKFISKKEYYIHEYTAIQDWFGNRGLLLQKGEIKEWCYDGHYLYFTCGKNAPELITPYDGEITVYVNILESICYECDHKIEYSKSPFANKVKE